MLKLMYKLNRVFTFINNNIKLLSLLSLIYTLIGKIKSNKFTYLIYWLLKVLIYVTIIASIGVVVYLTDLNTPINTTFSIYYDLLEPYIEIIKSVWSKIINYIYNLLDTPSINKNELESVMKDSTSQIKEGVKSGIKEALDEFVDKIKSQEDDLNNSNIYKNLALFSSVLFFGYFLFILPGPSITPEALSEYNWINQSLIEFKITVKDFILYLINNPGNPGAPANNGVDSPISPTSTNTNLNTYFPLEPTNSVSSEGLSTVTPNTPKLSNITMSEAATQTTLNGITVSKMVETVSILKDSLGEDETSMIQDHVTSSIKKITD